MDGYAVRAEDLAGASTESPARLRVIGEAPAGTVFEGSLGGGDAVRVMTGGLIPRGANAVIEVEATYEADGMVEARRALRIGESIREAGEDIRTGAEAIPAGKRLTPGDIGVLASLGVVNVPVRVKPKIGILSTGNEVVEPFRTPGPGQIRNSSSPALYAACAELGAEPIDLGIARDDRDDLEEKLEEGLRYDILLTTGGVSAGVYDLVQTVAPAMGVEIRFHKVNIRPGKPILFGTFGADDEQTLLFGLPGNPVSTFVTFRQFVAPAVRKLLGASGGPLRFRAALAEPIVKNDDKRHFIRAVLATGADGTMTVSRTRTQSSGAMSSLSRANCLIILEEDVRSLPAGADVTVELL
jgi:molybdopterin molybdotransferase